jgi:hypothetical protein
VIALILIVLVIGLFLAGLLWAGTLYLQNYWYTTATSGAYWQAPAAAAIMTVFWLIWCMMNVQAPGASATNVPFDILFRFNPKGEYSKVPVEKLWSVKKGKETILYVRQRVSQNRYEYHDTSDKKRPWVPDNVEEILIEDKDNPGQKMHFKRISAGTGSYRTYASDQGWEMNETTLGSPSIFHYGRFMTNILLNLVHLVLWFLCLWLLLRFQWSHALGLAVVLWLVTTLTVLWYLLPQAGAVAAAR